MAEVWAAIISVAVSLFVSIIVGIQNKSEFFSKTVSQERLDWMHEMRQYLAELLTMLEEISAGRQPDAEENRRFLRLRNDILVRLNGAYADYESKDQYLAELLAEPDFAALQKRTEEIRSAGSRILKAEWDKVKSEAGNSRARYRQLAAARKEVTKLRKEEKNHG